MERIIQLKSRFSIVVSACYRCLTNGDLMVMSFKEIKQAQGFISLEIFGFSAGISSLITIRELAGEKTQIIFDNVPPINETGLTPEELDYFSEDFEYEFIENPSSIESMDEFKFWEKDISSEMRGRIINYLRTKEFLDGLDLRKAKAHEELFYYFGKCLVDHSEEIVQKKVRSKSRGPIGKTIEKLHTLAESREEFILEGMEIPSWSASCDTAEIDRKTAKGQLEILWKNWDNKKYRLDDIEQDIRKLEEKWDS
jgi:hypothetical protein